MREEEGGYLHVSDLCEYIRKPELEAWRQRVGAREANLISKRALKLGNAVHEIARHAVVGQPFKVDKKMVGLAECVAAMQSWITLNKPNPVSVEVPFRDDVNLLVGTPDLVTDIEVVDWKSSSAIRPDYIVQVNTYQPMVGRKFGRIVRLDPIAALFTEYPFPFDDELYEATLGLARFIRKWKELGCPH